MERRHGARLVERLAPLDLRYVAVGVLVDGAGHLADAKPRKAAPEAGEVNASVRCLGARVPGLEDGLGESGRTLEVLFGRRERSATALKTDGGHLGL